MTDRLDATCPHCLAPHDAAFAADGNEYITPSPGDVTLCIHCAGLAVFTATKPRKPTEEEMKVFLEDENIITAMVAIRAANERRRHP